MAACLPPTILSLSPLLASFVATRTHSHTSAIHPLAQVQGVQPGGSTGAAALPSQRLGVAAALRHVAQRDGLRALWRGNGVTIIHRLPYSSCNFWIYEQANELWKTYIPAQGPWALGDVARRFFSGGVAGITACSLVRGGGQAGRCASGCWIGCRALISGAEPQLPAHTGG